MNVYLPNLRLPSAYQEVEYIGRNGNNYIDTGWVPNINNVFEIDIGYKISTSGKRYSIIGNYDGSNRYTVSIELNSGDNTANKLRFYMEYPNGGTASWFSSNSINTSGFNDLVIKSNGSGTQTLGVNGTTTTGSLTGGYYNASAYIFIDRPKRWSTFSYDSYVSYCKIKENGTLVRDFVPCYRKSDSVIGLYDLVNNQFYTNSGTGTFSKGNDVTMAELKNAYIGERWSPGSNTVAYRPLTSSSTVNDLSGNSHTLTNSGSVTFGTYKGVDCAYFNGNQLTQSFSWSGSIITVSAWWYYENIINASTSNVELLRYGSNFGPWIDRSTNKINCSPGISTNTIPSKNTSWVLLTYTYDGSGHLKLYINTTEIGTNNSASPGIGANLILCNTNFKGGLSNVIMEKSCWTPTEITNYYNLTKSNYGL